MARTPRIVEDRREHIMDAALHVFAEKGFTQATNRDIAREAGITTGLIYYYFQSKQDLLRATLEVRSPLQVLVQISPEMLEQPPETLLYVLVIRALNVIESEPFESFVRVMLSEMLHGTSDIAPIVKDFAPRILGFVSGYLKHQVDRGSARADLDVTATSHVLMSSMIGMVMRRLIIRDPSVLQYTHEELAHVILKTILPGIRKDR
jgi:AcrR family transcriptional regulator